MKKYLLLLTVLFSLHTQAQDTAKIEKIKTLFALLQQDSLIIKTMDVQMNAATKNIFSLVNNDSSISKEIKDSIIAITNGVFAKTMDKAKTMVIELLNNELIGIYDTHFSATEIDDLIAFYRSTSGKKFLKEMPSLQKEVMEIISSKYLPDLLHSIKDEMDERVKTLLPPASE